MLDDYDIILLDTPPALGYLTINALSAADILLVPLGASLSGIRQHGPVLRHALFHLRLASRRARTARGGPQGCPRSRFEWDAVRAIITRFDASQQTDLANVIQAYFGDLMTTHRQEFTALVGQAGEQVNGIYEADPRDFNRDTYLRGARPSTGPMRR